MNKITHYTPPTMAEWQGRSDSPDDTCFFQIMRALDLQKNKITAPRITFGLLGFCCDEGIRRNQGRIGAAEGPRFIRQALAKLPIHRKNILCYDAGDIHCTNNDLESAQKALSEAVAMLLAYDITPIVLGGGHEVAWGHFQGIAKNFFNDTLAVVNFDAHFDMRTLLPENKGSSGTPFLQMATAAAQKNKPFHYYCLGIQHGGNIAPLFTTAKNYQTRVLSAEEMQENNHSKNSIFVENIIATHEKIYLSFCLDVFAAAYAPGVSAPQALGLTPWQVIPLLKILAKSGKVLSYDIAELSPKHDIDSHTAKLAANLIYEIIHHHQSL